MYRYDTTCSRTPYVSSSSSSSVPVCTRSSNKEVLLVLAAACCCSTFPPDRDSSVIAWCRRLPPNMVTPNFAPVFFCFSSGIHSPYQPEPTLEFYATSIQVVTTWQRRDIIGGWLHHLRRSVAVRSDASVMVMLLHLGCIQRNEWSPRTFVSWFFTSCTT